MKSANTKSKFPTSKKEWDKLIAEAPDRVNDPDSAYDPNDPKAVDAFWKNAVVTKGGGVEAVRKAMAKHRKGRGPQKAPKKEAVTLRLDKAIVEHFRATGEGWQTRLNDALRLLITPAK